MTPKTANQTSESETVETQAGRVWHRRKGRVFTIGVTDAAMEDVGTPDSIDFPDQDETYDEGETILVLDGPGGQLEVACPLRGTVLEVNHEAKEDPEVVAEDPLEGGWLIRLEIA